MPWMRWLPWRFLIRRLARAHGFLDPMTVLARLHRFGQPSEVTEPIELLRSGVVFHARGLINSRIIQHNLDWVWPYWVERQFDPADDAFVPRAFSITHINLTHRNWTAIGWPDCQILPIVDPRGLLTPLFDGWSLDAWLHADDGRRILPSRSDVTTQRIDLADGIAIVTETQENGLALQTRARVEAVDGRLECRLTMHARSDAPGWLVLALRPYNPEGISFIHDVSLVNGRHAWRIDDAHTISLTAAPERHQVSDYRAGDVSLHLADLDDQERGECDLGMVTAAAMFRLQPDETREVTASLPFPDEAESRPVAATAWTDALQGHCRLRAPDERVQWLYEVALRSLILHSPGDVYPGPYTYKRFWYRDAAFIIHALLCAGLIARAERALDLFPTRQTVRGFFHSQEGEWDSNGEALWILQRFCALTGRPPKPAWRQPIIHGARWIARKRVAADAGVPHAGLLPAGFSAEHLGPNDFYYWDDFWGIAGLQAAAAMCEQLGDHEHADEFRAEAADLQAAVDRSLAAAAARLGSPAMPASPYRRMDAGAIGSLAAGYPLQLVAPDDPRLVGTVEFLLQRCFFAGGFFQDMVHSGINPYLTLHVAQVLLRAGDPRCFALIETTAKLASPTGQWPEAVHPRTRGGCMGDGQHIWAAAEWVMMIRNCFVREEGDRLIVGGGIPPGWLAQPGTLSFGPAPTAFGPVTVEIAVRDGRAEVAWHGDWHRAAPIIEVRLPGLAPAEATAGEPPVRLAVRA